MRIKLLTSLKVAIFLKEIGLTKSFYMNIIPVKLKSQTNKRFYYIIHCLAYVLEYSFYEPVVLVGAEAICSLIKFTRSSPRL